MHIFNIMRKIALAIVIAALTSPAFAAEPQIRDVKVEQMGMVWTVYVTIEHPDGGWDHYADGWEVLDAQGNRLGYRKLQHPHIEEQPFTRSLSGVFMPDGTREIYIRARCSVDNWSDNMTRVALQP